MQYMLKSQELCYLLISRHRNQFFDEAIVEDCNEFAFPLGVGHMALETFQEQSSCSAMESRILGSKVPSNVNSVFLYSVIGICLKL